MLRSFFRAHGPSVRFSYTSSLYSLRPTQNFSEFALKPILKYSTMPPRKASTSAGDSAEPTRRSARSSTQAKTEASVSKSVGRTTATGTTTTTRNSTKKRGAAEATGDGEAADGSNEESNKKAKSSSQTQDQTPSDEAAAEDAAEAQPQEPLDPIDIGGVLPTLTLKNEIGEDVQVAEIAQDRGVVMFLVPKADTPGCTTQACGFRDIYSEFTEAGYDVYCLSADAPSAQTKWQTKKELPYHLLSDPGRILISALGAGEGGKTKRSHFIFEKGGTLAEKVIPVKPADSPKLALEFIKSKGSS